MSKNKIAKLEQKNKDGENKKEKKKKNKISLEEEIKSESESSFETSSSDIYDKETETKKKPEDNGKESEDSVLDPLNKILQEKENNKTKDQKNVNDNNKKQKKGKEKEKKNQEKKEKRSNTNKSPQNSTEMDNILLENVHQQINEILHKKEIAYRYEIKVDSPKNLGKGINKFTIYQVFTQKYQLTETQKENPKKKEESESESESQSESESDSEKKKEQEHEQKEKELNKEQTSVGGNDHNKESESLNTEKYVGFDVKRRYKDFLWLRKNLVKDFPGTVVPTLPGKKIIAKFADQFVALRRKKLEIFLQKISKHKLLSLSKLFQIFIEKDSLNIFKTEVKRKQSFNGIKTLHNGYLDYNLDENKLEKLEEKVLMWKNYENIFKKLYADTQKLRNLKEKHSTQLMNFGESLAKFGRNLEFRSLVSNCNFLSKKMNRLSIRQIQEISSSQIFFEDAIYEQLQNCNEIGNGYNTRNKTYTAFKSITKKKEKSDEKLTKAKDKQKEEVSQLEKNDLENEKVESFLKIQNRKVTAVFIDEIEKMEKKRNSEIKSMLIDYSQAQLDVAKYSITIWEKNINALKQIN
ncbi:sorting nexin [Anaeramoeba flamelloides]|uniref:Sorting nexin n=1 Tax=Anaeramoeba flamelloides TaxID=1746091 RepID=A0ABQ8Z7B4_9EUKA|nr:sorting nexin [Anaeramoeba flamelloides]